MKREHDLSVRLAAEVYAELASQAKQCGYVAGSVGIYVRDRCTQLADPQVFVSLPPPVRSWPPPGSGPAQRGRRKLWFVLERKKAA